MYTYKITTDNFLVFIKLSNVGETRARCNNFAFELHNFLSKENKPKQNITFGSPFSQLEKLEKKNFNSVSRLSNSFTKGPVTSHPTTEPMAREVTDVGAKCNS